MSKLQYMHNSIMGFPAVFKILLKPLKYCMGFLWLFMDLAFRRPFKGLQKGLILLDEKRNRNLFQSLPGKFAIGYSPFIQREKREKKSFRIFFP